MDILTRTAKAYYEELHLQGGNQFHNAIFNQDDSDDSSSFMLDKLLQDPYAVSYRGEDEQSVLRSYEPGTGTLITLPRSSEKTPISESLRDKIAVGVEATAGFGANEAKMVGDVVKQHIAAHNMTKIQQAIDVLADGKFYAKGTGGSDLGLDIDFKRKSSLNLTFDFTQSGASFIEAIANGQEELLAEGTPLDNLAVMCGMNWLSEFQKDEKAQQLALANNSNILIAQNMTPPPFMGVAGLNVLGQIRAEGMLAPVWIIAYQPGVKYKKSPLATATSFVKDDEAVFFSTSDTRYNVKRGVVALDDSGKAKRVVGEVIFDNYTDNDPVTTFIRSQTRHGFVPANVNHTAKSTGTFA